MELIKREVYFGFLHIDVFVEFLLYFGIIEERVSIFLLHHFFFEERLTVLNLSES